MERLRLSLLKVALILALVAATMHVLLQTRFMGGLQWLFLQQMFFLPFFSLFGEMTAFFTPSPDVGFFITVPGQIAGVLFYGTLYLAVARLTRWVRPKCVARRA